MKKLLAPLLALALLAACSDSTVIKPVPFTDLSGWQSDHLAQPFALFAESCGANASRRNAYQSKKEGPIGVHDYWNRACGDAVQLGQPSDDAARRFFETHFQPYKVETEAHSQGLATGYYEPIIRGSKVKKAPYLTPVYGVPSDLGSRRPYYSREEILNGALKGRAPVLFYVDDPVKLFFLHVQGSGKIRLPDGSLTGLQYAGQNGYSYTSIGKILKDRGELSSVSLQTIRDWLLSHPDEMDEVMNQNQSYVFFKHGPGDKVAKGALGLPLTPERSIAIDNDRATYGVPTFLDTTQSEFGSGTQVPFQRLMVSQDTGGALHGPHRADIFYGQGERAEWVAGHQSTPSNVYWLLPLGAPAEVLIPQVALPPTIVPPDEEPMPDSETVTVPTDDIQSAPVAAPGQ